MRDRIEIFDKKVPFHIQQRIWNFVLNSNFRIKGWEDRDDIAKNDLHSRWDLKILKDSGLYSYVSDICSFSFFDKCIINLSKPGDYYYTHTHGANVEVILYYVNLEWQDGWAGETLFFDQNRTSLKAYAYTPGRILKFDGELPHTIRPQSIIAPQYRFTISIFFNKK